jgi:hypothetical protein
MHNRRDRFGDGHPVRGGAGGFFSPPGAPIECRGERRGLRLVPSRRIQ